MPIYEYACQSCGNEFEELQKIGADAPPCPKCAAEEGVGRKVSQTSFVLKGGGWYKDLYSGPSNRKDGDSSSDKSTISPPASSAKTSTSSSSTSSSSDSTSKSTSTTKSSD